MSSETANNETGHKTTKGKHTNKEHSSRKRIKHDSVNSDTEKPSKHTRKPLELETDPAILQRRQKQIDYGKNTVGYHNYLEQVPIEKRKKEHPRTPDKYVKYSRRGWDMLIKKWRINLHSYDPNENKESISESDQDSDK